MFNACPVDPRPGGITRRERMAAMKPGELAEELQRLRANLEATVTLWYRAKIVEAALWKKWRRERRLAEDLDYRTCESAEDWRDRCVDLHSKWSRDLMYPLVKEHNLIIVLIREAEQME